jgi:hypothetical protein
MHPAVLHNPYYLGHGMPICHASSLYSCLRVIDLRRWWQSFPDSSLLVSWRDRHLDRYIERSW